MIELLSVSREAGTRRSLTQAETGRHRYLTRRSVSGRVAKTVADLADNRTGCADAIDLRRDEPSHALGNIGSH
jgi:hypothetical protein